MALACDVAGGSRQCRSLQRHGFLRGARLGRRDDFVGAALPRWRWLALSLAGRGSAARYGGMVFCALQKLGQRGDFVGAALPRWRWLVLSLAGRGSAARYRDMVFCVVRSLANAMNL